LKEVIDTRFLKELFYSDTTEKREKTKRKMQALETRNEGILPTIVIAEITQITCELRGKDMAESRFQDLAQSGVEIQNLTLAIAKEAGILKTKHRNLPMSDCIIAATAIMNHAKILSDDPHFDSISEIKRVWI
jgi:predicted nucleic acid-binding protein